MSAASAAQLDLLLAPPKRGGKRDGAGRKKSKAPRHDAPHRSRDMHIARNPLHAVLRTLPEIPNLRRHDIHEALAKTLTKLGERAETFRIVHISLQRNHVHLIVEAAHKEALESGMRAFAISFARRINGVLGRSGKLWAYRYHTTTLTSPTQVRNAISYVLGNWRRHDEDDRDFNLLMAMIDPYSSAISFAGWSDVTKFKRPPADEYTVLPVAAAQTWMLAKGWELSKKPIKTYDVPGPMAKRSKRSKWSAKRSK
jgi:putative transposase